MQLARELARHPFFTDRLPYGDESGRHRELAAKVLLLEWSARTSGAVPDLGPEAVDAFARDADAWSHDAREQLKEQCLVTLSRLARGFQTDDPLLSLPDAAPLAYLLMRRLGRERRDLTPADVREQMVRLQEEGRSAMAPPDTTVA